jgi:hypothetical protein
MADSRVLRNATFAVTCLLVLALASMSMPRTRQLALVSREKTVRDLSGFSLANPQSLMKADGYLSASAYRHALESSAEKGQKAYVAQWKAKNLAGAVDTVKKAAALYSKWDVVNPYTGVSRDDLAPFPSWTKVRKQFLNPMFKLQ